MLAATVEDWRTYPWTFPVLVQPKLDGIRCLLQDGRALTRTLKNIPNNHIRNTLISWASKQDPSIKLFDGEILIPNGTFQDTVSAVMSVHGTPNFEYGIFDHIPANILYPNGIIVYHIETRTTQNIGEIERLVDFFCATYEGIIFRSIPRQYKQGRCTLNEGYLLKYKPFVDAEATISACYPKYHNDNPPKVNELGHTERSHKNEGMQELPELGSFYVRAINGKFAGVSFHVGSGFSLRQCVKYWLCRDRLVGKTITFKYQEKGSLNAPRTPIFKGFREGNV